MLVAELRGLPANPSGAIALQLKQALQLGQTPVLVWREGAAARAIIGAGDAPRLHQDTVAIFGVGVTIQLATPASAAAPAGSAPAAKSSSVAASLWDFSCADLDGRQRQLAEWRGKVVVVMNVASA
jgi:hypothetical protein